LAVEKCRFAPALLRASFVWLGLAWCCCPVEGADSRGAPAGAENSQKRAEIDRLIRELGAPTFVARQQAQRALVALGVDARSALEAASQDPDHEIRQRARVALAAIADVDFHLRLGEFVVDQKAEDGHGLPGWDRYRSLVGAGPRARRLFAEMQQAERDLLEAVDKHPAQSGTLLDVRCQQLEGRAQDADGIRTPQYPLITMAAVLFAASNPQVPVSALAGKCIYGFGSQGALSQAIQASPTGELVKPLLETWVARPFDRDAATGYWNLLLAMQFDLKAGIEPALALVAPAPGALLAPAPASAPLWEQYAILTIGKLGSHEHLAALERLLTDERSIPDRGGRESEVQIRDVALAAMIHLTGQKLGEYGFVHAKSNALYLFNTNTLGFNDPAAREEAIKKWRAWREKQKQ
jgi:hypothetical protein